jgi:hypothetical protein
VKCAQEVDVVTIRSHLLELDVVAFFKGRGDFLNCLRDFRRQEGFTVFDGKDDVIVRIVHIVVTLGYAHAAILPRCLYKVTSRQAARNYGKIKKELTWKHMKGHLINKN